MTTTTTANTTYDKRSVLVKHEKFENYEFFYYIVKSLKSAEYNAEFEIPEDFRITKEFEVSGIEYTHYANEKENRTAVKTVNPYFGVEVSFYEPDGEQTDFLFEIF